MDKRENEPFSSPEWEIYKILVKVEAARQSDKWLNEIVLTRIAQIACDATITFDQVFAEYFSEFSDNEGIESKDN